MMQEILCIVLLIPIVIILLLTAVRIVRFFYKFPMPQFFANIIDNPLRRAIQPPRETAIRHGLKKGMLAAYDKPVDFTKKEYIDDIVNYIRS
jgi:hypothetical protein